MTTFCPGCDERLNKIQVRNALSRFDNKTYICSDCGVREALAQRSGAVLTSPGKWEVRNGDQH